MQLERKLFIELYREDNVKRRYSNYDEIKIRVKSGIEGSMMKEGLAKDYKPKPDDVLYFIPGCSVPRFKLKDKFKTTIKPSNATVAFVSSSTEVSNENMLCVQRNLYKINGQNVLNYIKSIHGHNSNKALKFASLLLNYGDEIYIHEDEWYRLKYYRDNKYPGSETFYAYMKRTTGIQHLSEEECGRLDSEYNGVRFYYKGATSKIADLNCPIYHQDEIIKYLNDSQMVIDEQQYNQLRMMGNSSDEENIILVMELMANCDYEKSFIYLLLLLKEFNSQIQDRKEFQHVNFKAMLSFLGMDPRRFNTQTEDINHYMMIMKKYNKFTRSNIQRLTQFFTHTKLDNNTWTYGPILKKSANDQLDEEDETNVEFINKQTV